MQRVRHGTPVRSERDRSGPSYVGLPDRREMLTQSPGDSPRLALMDIVLTCSIRVGLYTVVGSTPERCILCIDCKSGLAISRSVLTVVLNVLVPELKT